MNPTQTSVAVSAVLTVLFCRPFQGELSWSVVLVALVAALALVLGAWCAPATGRPFALSGDAAWQRAKNVQLAVGAVVAFAALVLFTDMPGMAAIWGIVAALGAGALMPGASPTQSAEDPTTGDRLD